MFGRPKNDDKPIDDRTKVLVLLSIAGLLVLAAVLRWQYAGFGKGQVVIGEDVVVKVDVAASDHTRERGLSGREALRPDEGMLFLFPIPAKYTFWMKDMRFPLDAVWIKDGEIVDLSIGVRPGEPGEQIPVFFPVVPADSVLEVPAGFAARHGLRLGMPVTVRIDRRGTLR